MHHFWRVIQHTIANKRETYKDSSISQRKVRPVAELLNSSQSNILIQLKKDRYIPNTKEPHLHIHRRGTTYTDVGHNHRDLVVGNQMRTNVINEVLSELQQLAVANNPNAQSIIDYIQKNIL